MKDRFYQVSFQRKLAWLLLAASLVLPVAYGAEIFGVMRGYLFLLLPPLTLLYLPSLAGLALTTRRPGIAAILNMLACLGWGWVLMSEGLVIHAFERDVPAVGTLCALGAALLGTRLSLKGLPAQRSDEQERANILVPFLVSLSWGVLAGSAIWFCGSRLFERDHHNVWALPIVGAISGIMLVIMALTARPLSVQAGLLCALAFALPIALACSMLAHLNAVVRATHGTELKSIALLTLLVSAMAMAFAAVTRNRTGGGNPKKP